MIACRASEGPELICRRRNVVNAALTLVHVAVIKTRTTKARFPSRARSEGKDTALDQRRRLLADRADFVAGSIFLFENRDPEGDPSRLPKPSQFSASRISRSVRQQVQPSSARLFGDLKKEDLVTEDDLTLFYWPQTAEARIRLAQRLGDIGRAAPAPKAEPPIRSRHPGILFVRLTVYR
jgi:hypothetical protein